jgi:hypothetical protein
MSSSPSKREMALRYAARGWPVFPCRAGDKKPLTAHGFKDATTDPEQINAWWSENPQANIGIACGAARLVTVDVDVKNGALGLESWQALCHELGSEIGDTAVARTPSDGRHYVYRANGHELRSSAGKLASGLDVRAQGGYIVAPGSETPEGVYEWLTDCEPAELPAALAERPAEADASPAEPRTDAEIPVGRRNTTLMSLGGNMRRCGFGEPAIVVALLEENKRCAPPLLEREVLGIAASVTRYAPARAVGANPAWPKTLGEAAYHGPLGGLVKAWTPHNEADPAALLVTLLVGWGSLVSARPYHCVGDDRHPARLFACVVGRSSAARKGMSSGPPLAALSEVDPEWADGCLAGGLSTGEGLIYRVRNPKWESKDKKQDPVLTDAGVTDKRLLVQEAEFARVFTVMARKDNTLSAIIRDLYDTGSAAVMTKGTHDRTTGAHVCLVAHITAEELQRALSDVDAANGFANRFLWVCAERQKQLPFGGKADRAELEPHIHALQDAAGHIHAGELDGDVPWGEDAKPLWVARYEGLMPDVPGLLGKIVARGQPQVLRIALLYALADGCREIRFVHLEAALEVWRYCSESARYIFGDRTGDRIADRILDAIRHSSQLNRTQINALFAGNKTKVQIDDALESLASAGLIRRATPEAGAGRPPEVWQACVDSAGAAEDEGA